MEVILDMPFLILNNANIQFAKKKLTWRFYTAIEALSNTKQIELINKKKFAKEALHKEFEIFMIVMPVLQDL